MAIPIHNPLFTPARSWQTPAMTTLSSINPATGAEVGQVSITSASTIPEIVERARQAQASWAELPISRRGELLLSACSQLMENAEELGALLTSEMGKPLSSAIGEVKSCGDISDEIACITAALAEEVVSDKRTQTTMYRDPYGVCAVIAPWNFPISMPHWMCLPALMAGNTVVLKPSEETPLIAQAYVDALNKHLPENVLQIVHGADDQGKALVAADVDIVAFTGSREVGKKIMAACASGLKRVVLELGGKDPMLVLKGADLKKAGRFAANNSFRNAGQVCVSTERIYVHRENADELVQHLGETAATMKVGNGMDPETVIGPMINSRGRAHVLKQIEDAVAQGATIAFGGKAHQDGFVTPTVLRGVTHEMDIAREETFGPVACIIEVQSDQEALDLANDTKFGLGATVFGPEEAALAIGRKLGAGMIGINKSCGGASNTPWIGAQQSGYGFHSGTEGHRQFTQLRLVSRPSPKS